MFKIHVEQQDDLFKNINFQYQQRFLQSINLRIVFRKLKLCGFQRMIFQSHKALFNNVSRNNLQVFNSVEGKKFEIKFIYTKQKFYYTENIISHTTKNSRNVRIGYFEYEFSETYIIKSANHAKFKRNHLNDSGTVFLRFLINQTKLPKREILVKLKSCSFSMMYTFFYRSSGFSTISSYHHLAT